MQLGNWIRHTTTTVGAGDLALDPVPGWAPFTSQFAAGADGVGDYFYYAILDESTGAPYEAGIGRMSTSTNLVRSRVLASLVSGVYSEANTPVSLPAGVKRVVCADLAGARPVSLPGVRASDASRLLGSAHMRAPSGNSATLLASSIYCTAFEVQSSAWATGLALRVNTGAAGSSMRLGLYRLNANLEPGGLIDGTADIDTSTTGLKTAAFVGGARRLRPGWYYIALNSFGGAPAIFASESSGRTFSLAHLLGGVLDLGQPTGSGLAVYADQALPATFPTVTTWQAANSTFTPLAFVVTAAP